MGKKRRKLLIVLTALLLPLHFVRASSDLVIELTNGKYAVFNLQEKPVLTMAGTKLLIKTSSLSTDYERTDVVKFYFQDAGSVAVEPVQEKEVLRSKTSDEELLVMNAFTDIVKANYNTLKGYHIEDINKCFTEHPKRFLLNPDQFESILDKYDPSDLVRCINKNVAVIDKL